MHDSAFNTGKMFLGTLEPTYKKVLEIGSRDVNGGLRDVYREKLNWNGLDLNPGPGVDVMYDDPYLYPFADNSFDVCVSSSVFEHDEFFG
jgi:predicted SAM-dependent methyltransferase